MANQYPINRNGKLVFKFNRSDVELGDVTNAVICLSALIDTIDKALLNQGKINIEFDGYLNDPRELYEIQEVVSWMKNIDATGIPWFWLIDIADESSALQILMSCLLNVSKLGKNALRISTEERAAFFMDNFDRLNQICDRYEIPEETNERISMKIGKNLEKKSFVPRKKGENGSNNGFDNCEKIDFKLKGDRAEAVVHELATKSFFADWCYLNPKLANGKEICDLLVIYDDVAIIWQIKDLKTDDDGNYNGREVIKNQKQLLGAKNTLLRLNSGIELWNPRRGKEIFVPSCVKEVFLISALLGNSKRGFKCIDKFKNQILHVFNNEFIQIVLNELDTISDFTAYLKRKEDYSSNVAGILIEGGEEELLAVYLLNERSFPGNLQRVFVNVKDGIWEEFNSRPDVIAKKEADKISYLWDFLIDIQHTTKHPDYEKIAREYARTNRFERRQLGAAFLEALAISQSTPQDHVFRRTVQVGNTTYCFVFSPPEISRDQRREHLDAVCFVARGKMKDNRRVLGLATEKGTEAQKTYDFYYMELDDWGQEEEALMKELMREEGIFQEVKQKEIWDSEYPGQ